MIEGKVKAPPSKSMTIRAAAASLLARGETRILFPSLCEDARAAFGVIADLGARVETCEDRIRVEGGLNIRSPVLDCGESGLCLRLFTPIAALSDRPVQLTGRGTLLTRPMAMMNQPLAELGVHIQTDNGKPPVSVRGPLRAGKITVDASVTSQFLSGLLMSLPLGDGDSELQVPVLNSRPYVEMTLGILREFNVRVDSDFELRYLSIPGKQTYRPKCYSVEGDWSGAAFFMVAGALAGKIIISGLKISSAQADRRIIEALKAAGARLVFGDEEVTVENNCLRPFDFDATHSPDLIPALAALAAACPGRSRIRGVGRLANKESHRARALVLELGRLGVKIGIEGDYLVIEGQPFPGGSVNSHSDHRIAMACAVAGLVSRNGVRINGWSSVSKSYPGFFEDLKAVGGKIR